MLWPIPDHFPVLLDGSEKMATGILDIVAKQMDANPDVIQLEFYNEQLLEFKGAMGNTIYGQQYENDQYSTGLYGGKHENKYLIAIEIGQLKAVDKVVATLAHEIAHIKILGEKRLNENDEFLTDLVTVFLDWVFLMPTHRFNFMPTVKNGDIVSRVTLRSKNGVTHWLYMLTSGMKRNLIG